MQSETLPFYQMADGLLLPTLYDPFPNVILEAMACGLPVITTTGCGGAEFIVDGHNGYVCDATDIPALQQAVMALPPRALGSAEGGHARERIMACTSERLSAAAFSLSGSGELTMRILFVIDGLPGGGAEKVVLTTAAQFLHDGDRVSLISLRDVCEYPLPEGSTTVVADRCRKPWRKLTELSRRARQLDAAVVRAEQQGNLTLCSQPAQNRPHRRPQPGTARA